MNLFDYQKYHFIGIGGIGISAIARKLKLEGKEVSGSDVSRSEITDELEKLGIEIFIGHQAGNVGATTKVVIYTIAIDDKNPEILNAKERGLIYKSYPETLGELSKNMFTIAVSGTHGKTTTTAMIAHILKKAGLDPTVIVGSKMLSDDEKGGSNFLAGKSKYLVVEACEYKRSFLNINPTILVITNIEADHLDYYKDLDDIKSAFNELINKVPKDGFIVKKDDFESISDDFELLLPGIHNISNAKAAIKVAEILGIENKKAKEYLKDFKGTWRRLEYKGEDAKGNIFYDDYAHHPTEMKVSLNALKEKYPDRKIVCVFEAHQQSRTRLLFDDFVDALKIADQVFIAPIFITRETDDGETTNQKLALAINKFTSSLPVENVTELRSELQKISPPNPLLQQEGGPNKKLCIVLMGAGNIYKWTPELLK